jgi:hypothetical protein
MQNQAALPKRHLVLRTESIQAQQQQECNISDGDNTANKHNHQLDKVSSTSECPVTCQLKTLSFSWENLVIPALQNSLVCPADCN